MAAQGQNSRLAQMQMKFQKKQQQDRDKKLEQIKPLGNHETVDSQLSSSFGPGKVRQMFEERRQRGTGIDKSYPLQPISTQNTSITTNSAEKTTVTARRKVGVKQTNNTIISNVTTTHRKVGVKQSNNTIISNNVDMTTTNRLGGGDISNKLDAYFLDDNNYPELLDEEKFPDTPHTFDDELLNNTISTKLPNVGKLSLLNNNNDFMNNNINNSNSNSGTVKLKPVILKKSSSGDPAKTLNGNRRIIPLNKTAPSSMRTSQENSPEKIVSPRATSGSKAPTTFNRPAKPTIDYLGSPTKISNPKAMSTKSKITEKIRSGTPPANSAACKFCGRYFNEDRIVKHETICQKSQKKRKVFDITKHRVQGTEAEVFVKKAMKTGKLAATAKKEDTSSTATKKSDWRRKHEEFIQAIRAAKEVKQHLAKGGKLSDLPPPPPSENPDYVQCPHCNRRFNETAAERHIPKCATMLHNKPKPAAKKR